MSRLCGLSHKVPGVELAACKDTSKNSNAACSRLSIVRFAHGPNRSMGHVLGAEKDLFLIRGRRCPMVLAAAAAETCQSLPKRSPWGRLGSVLDTCKRLHRTRRRFQPSSATSLSAATHKTMNYLAMASRALGGPQDRRMRSRGSPDLRPIPERVRGPIYIRKK